MEEQPADKLTPILESRSEYEEEYDAYRIGEQDEVRGAILGDPLRVIEPAEPILCTRDTSVREAIRLIRSSREHQGAVCVVDEAGALVGMFTERDIMNRVVGADLDVANTRLEEVMTVDPVALGADDKIADALHIMAVRGFRNIPIVKDGRPIGIVFTRHFVRFIVSLFPEGTINRTVGDKLKNPELVNGA